MMRLFLIIALMLFGQLAKATPPEDPCPVTNKSRTWSAACFDTTKTGRQIKQRYRKKVVFDHQGFAAIIVVSPPELLAVDRRGLVVVLKKAHLANFDFEPSDNDIARFGYFAKNGSKEKEFKCGFYRRGHFESVVAPVYDHCDSFDKGTALVCLGCTDHCESGDCHETDFVDGEGLVINESNDVLRRFPLPSVPLCGAGIAGDNATQNSDQHCRARPIDPFSTVR
jgi:hypothetical protein